MHSEGKVVVSVITPSYNRGELLKRCYHSLLEQTCFNFEWIVVDDGSTDDTGKIMEKISSNENPFPVKYLWKKNGGKHTALNASHSLIEGKYVLILDSDDMLTPDAIAAVLDGWKQYADDKSVAIITFLRREKSGNLCAYAKDEYKATDILHYKRVRVISSDCCEVIRTELFRKYKFPVFENERFLAETALWYRVGLEGSCIYINKAIYICEYLAGGLSKSGKSMRFKNPLGGMYTSYLRMHPRCFLKERVRAGLLYVVYGHFAGKRIQETLKLAKPYGILVSLCYLPGTGLFYLWKRKYN